MKIISVDWEAYRQWYRETCRQWSHVSDEGVVDVSEPQFTENGEAWYNFYDEKTGCLGVIGARFITFEVQS